MASLLYTYLLVGFELIRVKKVVSAIAGCVPQLRIVGNVPNRLGRDTTQPTSNKVILQTDKHASIHEVSKSVDFGNE